MKSAYFNFVLILATITSFAESVPHEFCLEPFNDRDCNEPPVPVFYYYKSGSRCEVKLWRGCPTRNKFPDEFLCSHYCIGKLWGRSDEKEENGTIEHVEEIIYSEPVPELIEEINQFDMPEIVKINEILDVVIEDIPLDYSIEKLSFNVKTAPIPTEPATEAEPTEEAIEPVEETTTVEVTEEPITEPPPPEPHTEPVEEGDPEEVITT